MPRKKKNDEEPTPPVSSAEPEKKREDHGVDADRLPRTRSASHEEVRHRGQVRDIGIALRGLPKDERKGLVDFLILG